MDIQIKLNQDQNAPEDLSSKDKTLAKMLVPIKEYLENNLPKNKTQERLLDIIRELLTEQGETSAE